jgi:hypothetical protein
MFYFIDEHLQDNPSDVIQTTADVVRLLRTLMTDDREELQLDGRELSGMNTLLRAIESTLVGTDKLVIERICEPYAKGYRKGLDMADDKYRRGYSDGLKAGQAVPAPAES